MEDRWKVDKHIPLVLVMTIVGGILVQTFTFGWWMSKMDSRITMLEQQVTLSAPQADRITRLEDKTDFLVSGVNDLKNMLRDRLPTVERGH